MSEAALMTDTHDIVVEDVLPFAPAAVWRALTDGAFIARWMMEPRDFEPVVGNRFTFRTTPAGDWDGVIHCEVREVVPMERFVYAWKGGHPGNSGYGAPLDTVVTWTMAPAPGGTRLRMVHSGFVRPRNDTAYTNMSSGWVKCLDRLGTVVETKH